MQNKNRWYRNFRFKLFLMLCAIALFTSAVFATRPALARPALANDSNLSDSYRGYSSFKAISWGAGRLDLLARGSANKDLWIKTFDNNQWYPWALVGSPGGQGFQSVEAVSWAVGRLDVFIVDYNRTVWHKVLNGSTWGSWENIGAVAAGGGMDFNPTLGSGGIRAVSWGVNRIDLFTAGTYSADGNSTVYQHKSFNGSTWSPSQTGWQTLDTVQSGAGFKADVVSYAPNRLDVFMRRESDGSLNRQWFNGTAWQPTSLFYPFGLTWQGMSGGISPKTPSAVSWGPNRLDVFVRGSDGAVWIDSSADGGTSWTGWNLLGGGGSTDYDSPAVDAWGPNRLDVFENRRASFLNEGDIYHKSWNGSSWSGWEWLGAVPFPVSPEVVSWSANRLDLFQYATNGQGAGVVHKWWDGANWGPSQTGAWESLGTPP